MGTHVPPTVGGMSSTLPKYITFYVLLAGIGGGLFLVVIVLYCCKICMGRRLSFEYNQANIQSIQTHGEQVLQEAEHSGESTKDSEAAGGEHGTKGISGNLPENIKKACTVHYSGGGTKILMTGGLQRKVSEENQGFPSLSKSPRDVDGFKICSSSGVGRGEELHYKSSPPHSPHYLNSTVISIEPALSRNLSQSSSSSSLQHDHQSTQNSELPSPRSPRSRHNSGGSSLSRCGSRGSTARENRASMKSIPSRNSSFRRPVGGSLKDSKGHQRRSRGGSTGDSYLTINPDCSPRRSVSLRSPRHTPSRSPQSNFLQLGLYIGSENSVNAARDQADQKKFNPSPTMSTHSVISGQWTPLEVGLEWWKRKHKLELVQHENIETKINGKIRYNDVGSMEDVRGDISEYIFADSNEDSETPTMDVQPQQIKHQYRALWELRATLEEEDWATTNNPPKIQRMPGGPSLSPTIHPKEDTQALLASVSYSTEQSPDRDPLSSHTTSFESNTEPIVIDEQRSGSSVHKDVFHHLAPTSSASLASRRQSYKNVLHNRMKRLERSASIMQETGNATETTSFDSIETQESTSTDTSRLEAITTSIESTDNTDSTGESHQYQQQLGKFQFRCDSGYKSLENGSSKVPSPPRFLPRRCLSSSGADVVIPGKQITLPGTAMRGGSPNRNNEDQSAVPVVFAKVGHLPPPPTSPGRNVARKRRDFGRFERHSIGSLDSVREPLDEESGSADSSSSRAKGSLFYRYFRNPRSNSAYYTRDYSIDEKSDQLFREFSRCDPAFDMTPFSPRGSTKMYVRRNSSATRGTASLDLGSQRAHSSSNSGVYPPNKPLPRRASQHDSVDDELPLLIPEPLRGLPNTRFHNVGGHASIPIITVDDS